MRRRTDAGEKKGHVLIRTPLQLAPRSPARTAPAEVCINHFSYHSRAKLTIYRAPWRCHWQPLQPRPWPWWPW